MKRVLLSVLAFSQAMAVSAATVIAHEWGTFTSLQGGDGKLIMWQPLKLSNLPGFVYTWNHPGFIRQPGSYDYFSKFSAVALQRLETPVIYFYSDQPATMDVKVNFPNGWVTEWFPRADDASRISAGGGIAWSNLSIIPRSHGETLTQPATSDPFFAAREADSDFIRVATTNEVEKFLFYRGAGNFTTPLQVTMKSPYAVTVANTGKEPLPHLFVMEVNNGNGNFFPIDALKPGAEKTVNAPSVTKRGLEPGDVFTRRLCQSLAAALVDAGLYPREAEAMVDTWKGLWFRENGLRVLYILPRAWADHTLPTQLNPAPKEYTRVMVGRAEILPPTLEENIVKQISDARDGNAAATARLSDMLKMLGRFAQPAFERAVAAAKLKPDEQIHLARVINKAMPFE